MLKFQACCPWILVRQQFPNCVLQCHKISLGTPPTGTVGQLAWRPREASKRLSLASWAAVHFSFPGKVSLLFWASYWPWLNLEMTGDGIVSHFRCRGWWKKWTCKLKITLPVLPTPPHRFTCVPSLPVLISAHSGSGRRLSCKLCSYLVGAGILSTYPLSYTSLTGLEVSLSAAGWWHHHWLILLLSAMCYVALELWPLWQPSYLFIMKSFKIRSAK